MKITFVCWVVGTQVFSTGCGKKDSPKVKANVDETVQAIQKCVESGDPKLELNNKELTSLPPEIGNLSHVTVLQLNNNKLTSLPPEIGQLTNLKELEISANQFTSLSPEIGKCTQLSKLHANSCGLTSLPPEIGNLTQLTTLGLAFNPLTDTDLELLKSLENLESLYIGKTSVTKEGVASLQKALPKCKIKSDF